MFQYHHQAQLLPILIPPYLPCLIQFALQCATIKPSTIYLPSHVLKEGPRVCWSRCPQQLQLQTEQTSKKCKLSSPDMLSDSRTQLLIKNASTANMSLCKHNLASYKTRNRMTVERNETTNKTGVITHCDGNLEPAKISVRA